MTRCKWWKPEYPENTPEVILSWAVSMARQSYSVRTVNSVLALTGGHGFNRTIKEDISLNFSEVTWCFSGFLPPS